eukprot:1151777-Pelagomonas_calceolata.AAC.4
MRRKRWHCCSKLTTAAIVQLLKVDAVWARCSENRMQAGTERMSVSRYRCGFRLQPGKYAQQRKAAGAGCIVSSGPKKENLLFIVNKITMI